jgi:hypothetical protein
MAVDFILSNAGAPGAIQLKHFSVGGNWNVVRLVCGHFIVELTGS